MEDSQHSGLARRGFLGLTGSTALALLAGTATADDADASSLGVFDGAADVAAGFDGIRLTELGRYESGIFNEGGAESATVATAGFMRFVGMEEELRERGIRVFGPDVTAAQDFEPGYVTVSGDSTTAWVSPQENNALAEIDAAEVTEPLPLGFKDYSLAGNELDASNEDGGIDVRNWPIHDILQPDAIAAYSPGDDGETYIVTANEGDSRDYDAFSEEAEVADPDLDPEAFDVSAIEGIDSVEEL